MVVAGDEPTRAGELADGVVDDAMAIELVPGGRVMAAAEEHRRPLDREERVERRSSWITSMDDLDLQLEAGIGAPAGRRDRLCDLDRNGDRGVSDLDVAGPPEDDPIRLERVERPCAIAEIRELIGRTRRGIIRKRAARQDPDQPGAALVGVIAEMPEQARLLDLHDVVDRCGRVRAIAAVASLVT